MEIKNKMLIFVSEIINIKNMKKAPKAVGIYDKEIFIAKFDENGIIYNFDVLRPVTAEMLEELRDASTYKNYCDDLWRCAVRAGNTELGLEDFAQELIDEADVDNDPEAFPCKDESGLEYLTENERKDADDFLLESEDMEVGTWECSGLYPPTHSNSDFKKFDYVFDLKLATQYYKSLKKK